MPRKKIKSVTNDTESVTGQVCQITTERSPMSAPVKNLGGRPKGKVDPVAQLQRHKDAAIKSQRTDCTKLHKAISQALALPDKGCGTSGIASAVKALSGAMQVCHNLQVAAYGMHGDSRGVQAVIILPAVAVDMETWQALTGGKLPAGQGIEDPKRLRRVESDVYGEPGGDDEAG